jgi:hypothetical protein
VPFDPGSIDKNMSPGSGVVDYKLQRLHFLKSIESGEIDRSEACEIHPELLRVARSVAPLLGRNCPLCDDGQLRIVAYVFGPRLGGGGKCVVSDDELQRLAKRSGDFVSYEIEVCPTCCWNHLIRSYPLD